MEKGKLQSRSPYYEEHEIIREDTILGRGSFGIVYKGKVSDGNGEIALKLLKKRNGEPIREFSGAHKKEIQVLLEARHKNIVKFLGVVKKSIIFYHNEEPFMCDFLIFEYMANGNARDYVRYTESSEEKLLEISHGIACGMAYLHENDIIHRDLAARNILIDSSHKGKISDFGLSSIIDENHDHYTIKETTILPSRWIPRECLQIGGKFSKASDIWSFGVTLWEIWTKGQLPYGNMNEEEIRNALSAGQNPISFEIPGSVPQGIVQLLLDIFVEEKKRPSFSNIKIFLNDIKKDNGDFITKERSFSFEISSKIQDQISNSNSSSDPFYSAKFNISKSEENLAIDLRNYAIMDSDQNPLGNEINILPSTSRQIPSVSYGKGIADNEKNQKILKLTKDDLEFLNSLKENNSIQKLTCFDISAKKIPEILSKCKSTEILSFCHRVNNFWRCPARDKTTSPGYGFEDCIFKIPDINIIYGILKELYIENLEVNIEDCYSIDAVNFPNLKTLSFWLCNIKGDFDGFINGLSSLEMIELCGNTPLLEKENVESLLGKKSLKYIELAIYSDRQIINGSFTPIGPDGNILDRITQDAEITFERESSSLQWKQTVTQRLPSVEVSSGPLKKNLAMIEIKKSEFKLNRLNILPSLKENNTVKFLRCEDISVKKIEEILKKFKAIEILNFHHTQNCVGKCKYFDQIAQTFQDTPIIENCIFKMSQINGMENLKVLFIRNLDIKIGNIHVNLPALKVLKIWYCNIMGNLIDRIVKPLALERIFLWGNIPLLERKDVEALLRIDSLKYIELSKFFDREVINKSFVPIGPDGKFLPKIKQNRRIIFERNSKNGTWEVKNSLFMEF